ncbi:MAG: ABC transporter permease [Alphaproteobacteria bacterium]
MNSKLPAWLDYGVIPLLNLSVALIISGIVIFLIGENPFKALMVMLQGAFTYKGSLGYTLYYATNFVFTGLAVAIAFHAKLFNIGGEGQAAIAGLALAFVAISLGGVLPAWIVVLLSILAAIAAGAFWGFIPGWLQAKRGSHVVITTIMFNFIAASISVALLAGAMQRKGQSAPETAKFQEGISLPALHEMMGWFGIEITRSPANFSIIVALIACFFTWVFIWRTKWGYMIRASGASPRASLYAGHHPAFLTMLAMSLAGAMAGLMALNELLGAQQKLVVDYTSGYGFTGIAVALMGRNHPVGIILASLLFGMLYQGGSELDFVFQSISREFVLLIQGLIILFSGALAYMFNPYVEKLYLRFKESKTHG